MSEWNTSGVRRTFDYYGIQESDERDDCPDCQDPTQDLKDLILWLATTYGDNDPIWPLHDAFGHLLEANIRLAATWFRVVRGGVPSQLDALLNLGEPMSLDEFKEAFPLSSETTQSHAEVPSEKGEE